MAKSKAKPKGADAVDAEPKASITVEPEVSTIGAPVRIRVAGTEGSITAEYTDLPGIKQTLEPNPEGIAMATFQYSGHVEVSASRASKGKVSTKLTIR